MTREWVDDRVRAPRRGPDLRDKRWVLRCDRYDARGRCPSQTEPSERPIALSAAIAAGWFMAATCGDQCPRCLAAGHQPTATPHPLTQAAIDTGQLRVPAPVQCTAADPVGPRR